MLKHYHIIQSKEKNSQFELISHDIFIALVTFLTDVSAFRTEVLMIWSCGPPTTKDLELGVFLDD